MNILTLVNNLPTATLALFVVANVFPYIAAYVTRNPSWYTGAVTLLLSVVGGVVAEFSRADTWDWQKFLAEVAGAYVVALVHQIGLLRNTSTADRLHRTGPQIGNPRDDDKLLPVSAA